MKPQHTKDVEKDFLEPAFKYFVANGLENNSVRDLCKVMGISYGSLYYWFEGKDDFYISIMQYGIDKVAKNLFAVAFELLSEPERFFNAFLDEVDKYIPEMRVVFQATSSPEYGNVIRRRAEGFKETYAKYIEELSSITGLDEEIVAPLIYMLISIMVDYILCEDRPSSQMQLDFISNIVTQKMKK